MTTTTPPSSAAVTNGPQAPAGGRLRSAREPMPLMPGARTRIVALDGLRAFAVALVVTYHVAPGLIPAGFLGVSLFFTLSGFLITRLLLAERETTGAIRLRSFWTRRFRRLLPASLLTLAVVTVVWVAAGWMTGAVAGDVVASMGQVANWRFLVTGTAYGATLDASPVLHFWSLAIEEQFYLAYPLLVWAVVRRARRPARALGLALAGLLAASVAYTFWKSSEPLTVYFSTFSRAGEVLVGALLAVVTWKARRPLQHRLLGWLGAAAVLQLVVLSAASSLDDALWAQGGLTAVALVSALAVLGATQAGPLRQVLSHRTLVRIGEISYGIYLFHWPILTGLRRTTLPDWAIAVVTIGASLVLAELSIRLLEQPVRRGTWPRFRPALVAVPVMALVAVVAVVGAGHSTEPTFAFTEEKGITAAGFSPGGTTVATTSPAFVPDPTGESSGATLPPAGPPPPLAVSVFGDSTAIQMRLALTDADPRIDVRPGIQQIGCTLARGGPTKGDYRGDSGRTLDMGYCDWTDAATPTMAASGAEVAVVYGGFWDTVPRKDPGAWDGWKTIEDPEVAEHVRAEMVAFTDALHAGGARTVVWLTLAPNTHERSERNDRRLGIWNQLLAEAATQRPGTMKIVDIAGWFAGQPESLRPDGVHVTVDTGHVVVQEYLADQLLAAAGR